MFGSSRRTRAAIVITVGFVAAASLLWTSNASAQDWVVRPEWVKAHEDFLASAPLEGRGSATRDEAIAAAYVASEFEAYGLRPAPGMSGYTQVGHIVQPRFERRPTLTLSGKEPLSSLKLIVGASNVRGKFALYGGSDPKELPAAPIVVATNPNANLQLLIAAAKAKKIAMLIIPASATTERVYQAMGGRPLRPYLEGSPPPPDSDVLATLSASDIALLEGSPDRELALSAPVTNEIAETTNAVGYLPGTDPSAGILLVSAHLDHLGVIDGTVMPGANDDASGTTGVLELAHALASGKPMRRGILFVCYGSEELGGYGSRYFGAHSPLPLTSIVANLELEMIGAQDPKLPSGYLMMTGFNRSDLGQILKSKGALVTPDPYPEEHFFERSDNYSLALKGVVAHTVSGWAVVPTYHRSTDTIANLNITFMTHAIQSLIEPLRFIANGSEAPHWLPGGQPREK